MAKKFKFGFDVSDLADYTDQEKTELLLRSFYESKTFSTSRSMGADLEVGIKSSKQIQKFAVTAVPQTNNGCGFNASGDAPFTKVVITPGKIKYQDVLCPKTLEAKWTQKLLTQGQNNDDKKLTFMATIEEALKALIAEHNEKTDWQGDTASGNAYLNKYNGLIKFIDTAAVSVAGNTAALTSLTVSNAFASAIAMVDALPAKLKGKPNLVLYVGTDTYDKIVTNLFNLNNFHFTQDTAGYEMTLPVKGVKVIGVHGLDGTNRMFLMQASNITWGTDMEGEEDEFNYWYSMDDDNIKYSVKFSRGVVVAYPDEVVQFTLAS